MTHRTSRQSIAFAIATVMMASAVIGEVPNPRRESPPPGIGERAIAVGASAPDFSLDSALGGKWVLAQALRDGPVVLVFYRGDW